MTANKKRVMQQHSISLTTDFDIDVLTIPCTVPSPRGAFGGLAPK